METALAELREANAKIREIRDREAALVEWADQLECALFTLMVAEENYRLRRDRHASADASLAKLDARLKKAALAAAALLKSDSAARFGPLRRRA